MNSFRTIMNRLDPIPAEHRHLAPDFDAEAQAGLWNMLPPVCFLAGVMFVLFSFADHLFYPEVSWLLLFIRVLLISACWLPAAIAHQRRGQGSIYRLSFVTIAIIFLLIEALLVLNKDPTGPYMLAIIGTMIGVSAAPWPAMWMMRLNLIIIVTYVAAPLLLGTVADVPRFLFYSAALVCLTLILALVHALLTRLRWASFLSRRQVEAMAAENVRLYEQVKRFNEELEEKVEERTKELQEAYNRLELLDRNKLDFIRVVSHELRTPMTVFTGYSQMLLGDEAVKQNEDLSQLVGSISSSSLRLKEIVNTMLDAVKIDSGVLELYFGPVSLDAVLHRVQQELQDALKERNLTLERGDLTALPDIEGDNELLFKVFYNLVINAVKYTPDGGKIAISGRTLAAGERDLPVDGVEILVSDTGIGIDPRFHELIFTKFYQTGQVSLHSSGKTKFKGGGPGLGLAIARGIVEAHGGKMWVESPGRDEEACPGSQFYVVLPLYQQNQG